MSIHDTLDSAHDGPFGIHTAKRGDTYHVVLTGEFDLAAVEPVQAAVAQAFDGDTALLEIDLSQLTFLDSSGLRAILETRDAAAQRDVRLQIVRGIDVVQRVFAITGLEGILPFVDAPSS